MSKYVKCPKCDLNYIAVGEKCCTICDPKRKDKLISEIEVKLDDYRDRTLADHEREQREYEAFKTYRYWTKPR